MKRNDNWRELYAPKYNGHLDGEEQAIQIGNKHIYYWLFHFRAISMVDVLGYKKLVTTKKKVLSGKDISADKMNNSPEPATPSNAGLM